MIEKGLLRKSIDHKHGGDGGEKGGVLTQKKEGFGGQNMIK